MNAPEPEPVGWREFETTTDGDIAALPEALAVVVSQDSGARFVTSRNGRLTYWEQE